MSAGEPHVTLITGTSKGIGEALVRHYVEAGHIVAGCSRSAPDWTVQNYHHYELSVFDEPAVVRMVADIRRRFGHLDHLVNNAGVASMNHCLLTPGATVGKILDTNVTGTFLFSREAAKVMMARKWGRIVNIGSVVTRLRPTGEAVYAASKAAVLSLTESLARELSPLGITVNAVGVAPVDTDMIRGVPQDKLERVVQHQTIARWATMNDIINVTDFFLRPASDFVTGQTLYLGGV